MPTFVAPQRLLAAGAVGLAVAALGVGFLGHRPAVAQPPDQNLNRIEALWKEKKFTYQEAAECKGCHTAPTEDRVKKGAFEVSLLTEYAIWKVHDKHAQAYAVLEGPRGKEIAKLLGKAGTPLNVLDAKAGCIACHAMNDLSVTNQEVGGGKGLDPKDGVSCGGCHGPSSDWANVHADRTKWRDVLDAKAKAARGFRDLRDPVVRAELCMSCHIGSAPDGRVVSHAMMAAGHPPLPPIEMSTFSKNEPQHWREPKDTPAFKTWKDLPFQQTRFALIGNVVAVRETLKLARDRANFKAGKPAWVWPELLAARDWSKEVSADELRKEAPGRWPEVAMAHSDCFACHHDLNYPGFRQQRGFGYHVPGVPLKGVTPGRPLVRSWPLAALKASLTFIGRDEKKALGDLETTLDALAAASSRRPFGQPEQIAAAADGVIKWCDGVIADLAKADFKAAKVRRLLETLCSLFEATDKTGKPISIPDYETARQIGSLLLVVTSELDLKGEKVPDILKKLDEGLDLRPYSKRTARVRILLDIIRAAGGVLPGDREKVDKAAKTFSMYLQKIGDTNFLLKDILNSEQKSMDFQKFQNPFLNTLQGSVSNDAFTSQILLPVNINRLQEFSDEEQRGVLSAIARYKPDDFRAALKELKAEAFGR